MVVNVMASLILEDINLTLTQQSNMKMKGIDQRSIKPLGQLTDILVTIKKVTSNVDFEILDISY